MSGAPTPDPFSARQLQALRRIVDQRVASDLYSRRLPRAEYVRDIRLAITVARDGTYPASGDTFAIRFVDCGFTPKSPGATTQTCKDRTAEGDTDDADDVIAREINSQYVPEGTYVAALWQRGLEGDPDDYGEWWIRLSPAGCYSFTDLFNRTDSTDVGSDWEECSGDWEILSNTLTVDTDDAVISCLHMVGWPVGLVSATVVVNDPIRGINSFGGIAQIYAYVGTEALPCSGAYGEWRLELTVTDGDDGELRLYYGGTLIGTRACAFTASTTIIHLCVSETEIIASCDDMIGFPIWTCLAEPGAHWFGLGSGAAAAIHYDAFTYTDQFDHNKLCPTCDLPCCCPCIEAPDTRPTLLLTVVPGEDPDCYLGGEEATLECNGLPNECCVWTTPDATPLVLVCHLADEYELEASMECGGNACEDYHMTLSWKYDYSSYCLDDAPPSEWPQTRGVSGPCSCVPLSLTFGPFTLWRNPSVLPPDGEQCFCCQEFYVVVTGLPT